MYEVATMTVGATEIAVVIPAAQKKKEQHVYQSLYTYTSIYLFANVGIALRILVSHMCDAPATSPTFIYFGTSYFVQNILGTFLLGVLSHMKKGKQFVSPSITTGFCGSLTTYSSWQLYVITQYILKNNNYQTFDIISNFIVCHCVFYLTFVFGRHMGDWLIDRNIICPLPTTASNSFRWYQYFIIITTCCLFVLLLVLLFFVENMTRPYILCCVLGSFGALVRYKLCLYNIGAAYKYKFRYMYTFIVNVLGSMLIFIVYVFLKQHVHAIGTGVLWIDILYSIQIGFCGSLTTVSTFMNELHNLNSTGTLNDRGYMYKYLFATFFVAHFFGWAILSL